MHDYLHAALGGALIGSAALLLYAGSGRIAGISGISHAALWGPERAWRWWFLAGLAAGGWLALPAAPPPRALLTPVPWLLLAGLLVGFGTRLGNGCTSGHGICGLARLSPRSLAAVLVFMAVGVLTASLLGAGVHS